MDLRKIAQGAPYFLVIDLEECPLDRFWVVQLSCGFDIFQTNEDRFLDEPNPWMRLKQFCKDFDIKPMNMARANKDLNPITQINFDPLADAYYYSKRIRKLMCGNPILNGYSDQSEGFGQLFKNTLRIVWELEDGSVELEERNLTDHPKSGNVSLIHK